MTKKSTKELTSLEKKDAGLQTFLEPTDDIVFKKLFDVPDNRDLLIDFLNNILELRDGELIESIDYNDPILHQLSKRFKNSIVDVRCTDQMKRKFIVEMQAKKQDYFIERVQYYVATALSLQLGRGKNYEELLPVILVSIAGWNLFEDHARFTSTHKLMDTLDHICRLKLMRLCFVELDKFDKNIDDLDNNVEKWIYFFKNAQEHDVVPEQMQDDPVFSKAFAVIDRAGWTAEELTMYHLSLDAERAEENKLSAAKNDGRAEGKAEGRDEEKRAIARNLLSKKKFSVEDIADATGLTTDAIKRVEKEK